MQELAGIYFPEPGCSPALDALAAEFATALPPPAAAGAQAVFEYSPKEAPSKNACGFTAPDFIISTFLKNACGWTAPHSII